LAEKIRYNYPSKDLFSRKLMQLTIHEYSKYFKMSKEMLLSKLKNKELLYTKKDGNTYIIVPPELEEKALEAQKQASLTKDVMSPQIHKQKTTVAMVLSLYQKENQQLKQKIVQLEEKIDKLINDKEQMLRDEMQKIEKVYSAKDEQLKTIIELIHTKLINENKETVHDVQTLSKTPFFDEPEKEKIVELKEYLKTLDLEPQQRKIIKKRFLAAYGSDIRILKQNGKLYLNFTKYDYSDLLE